MYQKKKRNFTRINPMNEVANVMNRNLAERSLVALDAKREEEVAEILCSRYYDEMQSNYRWLSDYICSAKNNTYVVDVLRQSVENLGEALVSTACWLPEERCGEWCDTSRRFVDTVVEMAKEYCRKTKK